MAAIDLYSGIGGWTLGLKMAGIDVVSSYEWWRDANDTHNKNFGTNHNERDIRKLSFGDLPSPEVIDFVVGSPPCTQFSLANRGGKGDIADGLKDIAKFLEVVEYLKPKYWAMENVPRVASILERELENGGSLERFKHLFGDIRVYCASDFGVPQARKRMIAGRFPFELFESYSGRTPKITLGDVICALEKELIVDPIYNMELPRHLVSDHVLEPNLSLEEERINREAKTHHPVYNKMSFPDRLDRPSRTITALCTRVSRESIIINDSKNNLRRLTIRERSCLQSFPIHYQFFSKAYPGKIKMIGNAVPPLLTFYIAQSMQETPLEDLILPKDVAMSSLNLGVEQATSHTPESQGAKFPWKRTFKLAIPGLRLGSGVRFELTNSFGTNSAVVEWGIQFFYGSSKNIVRYVLSREALEKARRINDLYASKEFQAMYLKMIERIRQVNSIDLQKNWTNVDRTLPGPIELIDSLGDFVQAFKNLFTSQPSHGQAQIKEFMRNEFRSDDGKAINIKKLEEHYLVVFVGIIVGASFNEIISNKDIELFTKNMSSEPELVQ